METRYLYCSECHRLFQFTGGEQAFYLKMGLSTPKRCPRCRKEKKARYADPYNGWENTMSAPSHTKPGHTRVHYPPHVVGGFR